jgi:hypothetical protein
MIVLGVFSSLITIAGGVVAHRLLEELRPDILGAMKDGADFDVTSLRGVEDQMR